MSIITCIIIYFIAYNLRKKNNQIPTLSFEERASTKLPHKIYILSLNVIIQATKYFCLHINFSLFHFFFNPWTFICASPAYILISKLISYLNVMCIIMCVYVCEYVYERVYFSLSDPTRSVLITIIIYLIFFFLFFLYIYPLSFFLNRVIIVCYPLN